MPGEKRVIGAAAARAWEVRQRNLPPTIGPERQLPAHVRPRPSPVLVMAGGLVAGILEMVRGRRERA